MNKLRSQCSDTNDKIRRIAKGSNEVIIKCDLLQNDNNKLKKEIDLLKLKLNEKDVEIENTTATATANTASRTTNINTTTETLKELKLQLSSLKEKYNKNIIENKNLNSEINALSSENELLNNTMDLLLPETESYQLIIENLEDDGIIRDNNIEKLHKRCHNLVINNKERHSELENKINITTNDLISKKNLIKKLTNEILKAQNYNLQLKERVNTERKNAAQLSTQLIAALGDVTSAQLSESKWKEKATNPIQIKTPTKVSKKTKKVLVADSTALEAPTVEVLKPRNTNTTANTVVSTGTVKLSTAQAFKNKIATKKINTHAAPTLAELSEL